MGRLNDYLCESKSPLTMVQGSIVKKIKNRLSNMMGDIKELEGNKKNMDIYVQELHKSMGVIKSLSADLDKANKTVMDMKKRIK